MKNASPELVTDRLRLRQFDVEDFVAYQELCSDPEVMRYLGGVLSAEDAWRQMAFFRGHWDLLGYGMYAVEERSTGEFVGRVGYLNPAGWPGFEVGWTLCRSVWGRGFATEAASAAVNQAFSRMGAERVISLIAPDNRNSAKVAERLRQRVSGETVVRGFKVRVYSIANDEWQPKSQL